MGTNSGDGYWEQLDSGCFWGMTYYYNIRRQRSERIYTTKTDDYQRTLHFLRTAYTNPAFFLLWSKRESRHVGIKRWKRINRQREIPFAGLNTSTNARQSSHLIRQPMGDGSMSLIHFSFLISIYFFFLVVSFILDVIRFSSQNRNIHVFCTSLIRLVIRYSSHLDGWRWNWVLTELIRREKKNTTKNDLREIISWEHRTSVENYKQKHRMIVEVLLLLFFSLLFTNTFNSYVFPFHWTNASLFTECIAIIDKNE